MGIVDRTPEVGPRTEAFNKVFAGVDREATKKEADIMVSVPISEPHPTDLARQTQVKQAPLILIGNGWSQAARTLGAEREYREASARFLKETRLKRNWLVEEIDSRVGQEIAQWAHVLTDRFVKDTLYVAKVELGLPYFAQAGLDSNLKGFNSPEVTYDWTWQEGRHGKGFLWGLERAGRIDEIDRLGIEAEMKDRVWTPDDHPGFVDSPESYEVFGAYQEWATVRNYQKERRDVREMMGLVVKPWMSPDQREEVRRMLAEEKRRGYEYGFSEYFRVIIMDETVHHMTYADLLRIGAKYFQDRIYDAVATVRKGSGMPYNGKLEGGEEVAKSMYLDESSEEEAREWGEGRRVVVNIGRFNRSAFDRISRMMGVKNLDSMKALSDRVKVMKAESDVDQALGAAVLKVSPDGTLTPHDNFSEIVSSLYQE